MADIKISALPTATTPLTGAELVPIVQGAVTKQTTTSDVLAVPITSLTASSAVATDASKKLVSVANTGTGDNVLANGPTLVAPALGTPASGNLLNAIGLPIATGVSGLGTGVATALAVNVGTAGSPVVNGGALGTPSSGTVTNLTGTANITVTGGASGAIAATTLSASSTVSGTGFSTYLASPPAIGGTAPAAVSATSLTDSGNLTFTGTGNRITGDFSNTTHANRVLFQTNTAGSGTTVAALPSATGGNSAFNVYGSPDVANTSFGQLRAGADTSDVRITSGILGTGTYVPMTFYTGGSERVRVDTSGNVGIGTASPGSKLQINTAAASTAAIKITDNTNYSLIGGYAGTTCGYIGGDTGSSFALYANNSEKIRIDSSGNVGIGAQTAAGNMLRYLDVQNSDTGASAGAIMRLVSSNVAASGNITADIIKYKNGSFYINNNETNAAAFTSFGVGASERMRIDSSGNVTVSTAALLGYGTGSGGTVTQATSKSTTVTLNKPTGKITMNNAALPAITAVAFQLANSLITANDTLICSIDGGTANFDYIIQSYCGAGYAQIRLSNNGAISRSEAVAINFSVIKGSIT